MSVMVPVAMFGFLPLAVLLFAALPARRAVLVCYVGGWLLLPQANYHISHFPDYNRYSAIAIGTLLGAAIFDSRTFSRFRPRAIDLPMAVFCVWPMMSYLNQGGGPVTGLNWILVHLFTWGIPYLLGRMYFADREGLHELANGIFIGGLVYAPLCWLEVRFSPKLHLLVYGYFPHSFLQHMRYGGFRPIVFMQHGLMVAFWMASASVVGLWLWQSNAVQKIGPLPMWLLVPFMILTTVACKSGNGVIALGLAVLAYVGVKLTGRLTAILVLALLPPLYLATRATGFWSGENLVAVISKVDPIRAGSLGIRMHQENLYTAQAMKQPLFGWAGPGMIPKDDEGKRLTRGNDAFWIITFGMYGLVSLASIFTVLAAAPMVWVWRQPLGVSTPEAGPATGLAAVVILFAVDCLVNGMLNPIFLLAAGALAGGHAQQPSVYQQVRAFSRTLQTK